MTDLRQAAQMALEAYDKHEPLAVVMEELRAALEQQAEPVAWLYKKVEAGLFVSDQQPSDVEVWNDIEWSKPLYTALPQRTPLTVNEVEKILAQHNYEIHGDRARYIVRMTEAAHDIEEKSHE